MALRQKFKSSDENLNETFPKTKRAASKQTFLQHEVPEHFHEPYITSGYRDVGNVTALECIKSMFTLHNETFNVWSHLIATAYFIVHFYRVLGSLDDLTDPYVYPLIGFAFAICFVFLASSLAHLFNCISLKARHICFYIDYASVSIFTFTSGQVNYFYSRPAPSDHDQWFIYASPAVFLAINHVLAFMVFMFCSVSRHQLRKYRFLLRTVSVVTTWFYDVSPFFARVLTCVGRNECNPAAYGMFRWHFVCYAISALCNVARIPERFMPGYFDLIGYSHHFLHFLCVVGNALAFEGVRIDMMGRREVLASLPQPTFLTSFGYLLLLIVCNSVGVLYFSYNLDEEEEVLYFNEGQTKKEL